MASNIEATETIFNTELKAGDLCIQLYQYKDLLLKRIAKVTDSRCTFEDGSYCNPSNAFSLAPLGVTETGVHGKNTDILGNELHVGDTVLFIDNSYIAKEGYDNVAIFRKGIISSFGKQKTSIRDGQKRFSKINNNLLSLTAYQMEDMPICGVTEQDLEERKARYEADLQAFAKEYPNAVPRIYRDQY